MINTLREAPNGRVETVAPLAKEPDVRIRELTAEEGRELFDRAARFHLDMSGEEFLKAWDAGKFKDPDQQGGMEIIMLLPFAR